MTFAFSAVARRLSTAPKRNSERAWQSIIWQMETSQQKTSTAAETGGLQSAGRRNGGVHLIVIIQSDGKPKTIPL